MEGTRLLNLDEPIEFIPESEADKDRPFKFYIMPLDWYEAMTSRELYDSYEVEGEDQTQIRIKPEYKDRWFEFVAKRLMGITEGDTELPVNADTVKRLPTATGMHLFSKIFKMIQGVTDEQSKN